jgi:hypothetical protein
MDHRIPLPVHRPRAATEANAEIFRQAYPQLSDGFEKKLPGPSPKQKWEKVGQIRSCHGFRLVSQGLTTSFEGHGIFESFKNQRTRQPVVLPSKGRNRIARSALCGGKLKTLPR